MNSNILREDFWTICIRHNSSCMSKCTKKMSIHSRLNLETHLQNFEVPFGDYLGSLETAKEVDTFQFYILCKL